MADKPWQSVMGHSKRPRMRSGFSRRAVLAAGLAFALGSRCALGEEDDNEEGNPALSMPGARVAPNCSIDLRPWKLTLPISKSGGRSGEAVEVLRLPEFELPPYFDVSASSITLAAPADGARTSGSRYPRSELREMGTDGQEYEWTSSLGGRLAARLRVNELPKASSGETGAIIIGQIHGPDDELCRLYYDAGALYFMNDKSGPAKKEIKFVLEDGNGGATQIPVGTPFSYLIDVNATRLQVTVKYGKATFTAADTLNPFWRGKKLYFKAGCYVQVSTPGSGARVVGSGRGSVTFTSLTLHH